MALPFRAANHDTIDLLRAVVAWADAQPEYLWHPSPPRPSLSWDQVIGLYIAVERVLGCASIEEVLDEELDLAHASARQRRAAAWVRTTVLGAAPQSGSWRCDNDRYCPTAEIFSTVEAFLDMCRDCFGSAPHLTQIYTRSGTVYADTDGTIVLREVV